LGEKKEHKGIYRREQVLGSAESSLSCFKTVFSFWFARRVEWVLEISSAFTIENVQILCYTSNAKIYNYI
jgi:hypothetical protein